IICVDLGGSRVRTALFDLSESTLLRKLVSDTPKAEPVESVIRNIKRAIAELLQDNSAQIQAIVVGSPGPLDIAKGIVIHAPLFQDARDIPIASEIQTAFGVKTWVQNDANLAALGEYAY